MAPAAIPRRFYRLLFFGAAPLEASNDNDPVLSDPDLVCRFAIDARAVVPVRVELPVRLCAKFRFLLRQVFPLLADLGGERLTEVLRIEQRTDFESRIR